MTTKNKPKHYMREYGSALIENGYPIIPLAPYNSAMNSAGKAPAQYANGSWYGYSGWPSVRASHELMDHWAKWPSHNIGIVCGKETGITAIDSDVMDPKSAAEIDKLAHRHFGKSLLKRIGRNPRTAYLIRVAGELSGSLRSGSYVFEGEAKQQCVECITTQIAAYGMHPQAFTEYCWPELSPLNIHADDIPEFTINEIKEFLNECDTILLSNGGKPQHKSIMDGAKAAKKARAEYLADNPAEFKHRISLLRNDDLPYNEWVGLLHTIKGTLEEYEAYVFAQAFSMKADKFEQDEFDRVWQSIDPNTIHSGAGTIKVMTDKYLHPHPSEDFEPIPQKRSKKRHFTSIHALTLSNQKTSYLVDSLIPENSLSMIYGPSGSGKSWMVLDIMTSISRGIPWNSHKTEQGSVVYLCLEGAASVKKRLMAYCDYHGLKEGEAMFDYADMPLDLNNKVSVQELVDDLKELELQQGKKIKMIAVDTLARASSGADENSFKDMSKLVANLDKIKHEIGCSVLCVHHSGKSEARGARGHSSLRAAVDVEIEVKDFIATVTKQRDGEGGEKFKFELAPHQFHDEVEQHTSAIVRFDNSIMHSNYGALKIKPDTQAGIVYEILKSMEVESISRDELYKTVRLHAEFAKLTKRACDQRYSNILSKLVKLKLITKDSQGIIYCPHPSLGCLY